jgi:hypothetical protein
VAQVVQVSWTCLTPYQQAPAQHQTQQLWLLLLLRSTATAPVALELQQLSTQTVQMVTTVHPAMTAAAGKRSMHLLQRLLLLLLLLLCATQL